ncbi:hypothetical protein [Desulfovibrio sp.]|uniref:hypothetical protein n=1 Tax=Desulfovibrio sp. TaxID=885 RepID=UPI0025C082AD|nr:hypothetical protein [Desulfovibrio sp.]
MNEDDLADPDVSVFVIVKPNGEEEEFPQGNSSRFLTRFWDLSRALLDGEEMTVKRFDL